MTQETEILLDRPVNPSLVIPNETLGSDARLDFKNIRVRLAEPFVVSLRMLIEKSGLSEFDSPVLEACDAWLMFHTAIVSPDGSTAGPAMIGMDVELDENAQASVQELFPQSEFVKTFGGGFEFRGGVDFNGEIGVAEVAAAATGGGPVAPEARGPLVSGSAGVKYVAEMAFDVFTPRIVVSGKYTNRSEWLFYRHDKPLLGDIQMVQTLLVPKGMPKLSLLRRVRAAVPSKIPLVSAALRPSPWDRAEVLLRDSDKARFLTLRRAAKAAVTTATTSV